VCNLYFYTMVTVALLPIGDELLSGSVTDTNSAWIANKLFLEGIPVQRKLCVGDNLNAILEAIEENFRQSDIIIMTGGLGPTKDDVSKQALSIWSDSPLMRDEATFKQLQHYMQSRGRKVNELNASQAEVPKAARVLPNKNGTAPGMWFEKDGKILISLPGVPYEMKALMEEQVLPLLKQKFSGIKIWEETLRVSGIPESELALLLTPLENELPPELTIAYLPEPGQVKVKFRIAARLEHSENAILLLQDWASRAEARIGSDVYGRNEDTLESVVINMLKKDGKTLSLAESCTGGNLGGRLVQVSGASEIFSGGVIAYSNEVKSGVLGVNPEIIQKYGAVSESVACAMAKGVRKLTGSDYGISITGIAGPGGGSFEKPVGTVWIGLSTKDDLCAFPFLFEQSRERNIIRACLAALSVLRKKHLGFLGKPVN